MGVTSIQVVQVYIGDALQTYIEEGIQGAFHVNTRI